VAHDAQEIFLEPCADLLSKAARVLSGGPKRFLVVGQAEGFELGRLALGVLAD
jgi:hypothetical protein